MTRRGWALFLAMSLIWGTPYLLITVAVQDLHPAVVVALRCALGCALLLPIAAARGQLARLRGHWRWVLLFAGVEMIVPWVLLGFAQQRLPSSLTGLLIAMVPLVAALLTQVLGLDSLDRRRVVGLLVGLAGVALLIGVDVRGGDLVAVLAVLGVVLGYAVGPIVISTKLREPPSLAVIAASLGVAAIALAPWALVEWPSSLAAVAPVSWWSVAGLGVLTSAVAFLVFFALIAEVGPARASVITYLNPVVALGLGVWLLGEEITAGMLVGFGVIVVGSWLATSRSRAPRDASVAPEGGAVTAS